MGRKIPFRLVDEEAMARMSDSSSGSEHSTSADDDDLSHLVDSFIERDDDEMEGVKDGLKKQADLEKFWLDSETKHVLKSLLVSNVLEDQVKQKIYQETELVCGEIIGQGFCDHGFKRRLMSCLRERGLDAGLCKSRSEKSSGFSEGNYEYVDVNVSGKRYIVEVSLVREFEVARPSERYLSLLEIFPRVFVGKPEELEQVVRLMCAGMKESMKSNDMPVPPWRRTGFMMDKWFGSYKRTTNEKNGSDFGSVGPVLVFGKCREELVGKVFGFQIGCSGGMGL